MPELIEVEQYRAALDSLVGERVEQLIVRHRGFVRPKGTDPQVFDVVTGGHLARTSRHGKLLLLEISLGRGRGSETDQQVVLGMRFGMTGMLFVDGVGPIDALEYASTRADPEWVRLVLEFAGSTVTIRDQRRLGSIELNPDTSALGTEATHVTVAELADALRTQRAVKSVLLDQSRIAGLGNLLTDEILWRAGVAPHRRSDDLSGAQVADLASQIHATIHELTVRGGSHMGDSFPVRSEGAICPSCEGTMTRSVIVGRASWWCPAHQS